MSEIVMSACTGAMAAISPAVLGPSVPLSLLTRPGVGERGAGAEPAALHHCSIQLQLKLQCRGPHQPAATDCRWRGRGQSGQWAGPADGDTRPLTAEQLCQKRDLIAEPRNCYCSWKCPCLLTIVDGAFNHPKKTKNASWLIFFMTENQLF